MNTDTGQIYEGEEIKAARQRGEPLLALHGDDAIRASKLCARGVTAFTDPRLAALATAERKRRRKQAKRDRVANAQRARGKR